MPWSPRSVAFVANALAVQAGAAAARSMFGFVGFNGVLAALAAYVIVAADLRLVVLGSLLATWLASYVYRRAPVPVLAVRVRPRDLGDALARLAESAFRPEASGTEIGIKLIATENKRWIRRPHLTHLDALPSTYAEAGVSRGQAANEDAPAANRRNAIAQSAFESRYLSNRKSIRSWSRRSSTKRFSRNCTISY